MTGDVTGSELAEFCQQSHVSVTGHNIPKPYAIPKLARDGSNWITWRSQTLAMLAVSQGCHPLSRINLAWNNVQLPTPPLSPIFKHQLPIHPWISIFDPNDHHLDSLRHIASIIMSNPDALRSIFEDHLDLEMDNLAKPNPILSLKWSILHSRLLAASSAPSWHFPLILRLLLQ